MYSYTINLKHELFQKILNLNLLCSTISKIVVFSRRNKKCYKCIINDIFFNYLSFQCSYTYKDKCIHMYKMSL